MTLGGDFVTILKDTVKLTDSVERLNSVNIKLQDRVDGISDRVLRLETRLDTYAKIAGRTKRLD